MRYAAKRINFALLYGMAAFTLGKDLGVSTAEAKSYIESYFNQFPRVRGCLDGILEEARRTREVTTLFGRVRPIPEIAASNPNVRGNAERMALNAPFQGSAADIIKIAMVRLDRELVATEAPRRGCSCRSTTSSSWKRPDGGSPKPCGRLVGEVMEGRRAAQGPPRRPRRIGPATGSPPSEALRYTSPEIMRQGRSLLLALAMTGAAGVCSPCTRRRLRSPTPAPAETPGPAPAETPTPAAGSRRPAGGARRLPRRRSRTRLCRLRHPFRRALLRGAWWRLP